MDSNGSKTWFAIFSPPGEAGGRSAEERFYRHFAEPAARYVARLRLGAQDAEDVVQEALTLAILALRKGTFDPGRGRLSAWVFRIVSNRARDARRQRRSRREARGYSALGELRATDLSEQVWMEELDGSLFRRALELLRGRGGPGPRALRAFELHTLQDRPLAEVAATLEMSRDAAYRADKRCRERLRELRDRLGAELESY